MSDAAKYRTKEEVEHYKTLDTIENVKNTILTKKFATEAELDAIEAVIMQRVEESVEFAENSPYPDASEAFKDVYVQEDYPYTTD